MMTGGIEAEQLTIQHVREPCDGDPITGMKADECPFEGAPGEALLNKRIGHDVSPVIKRDKGVTGNASKSGNGDEG